MTVKFSFAAASVPCYMIADIYPNFAA